MEKTEIFSRFADIPGVGYEGHPRVDRRQLSRHDDSPRVIESFTAGKFVMWDSPNGVSTSQSPASARASLDDRDASPSQVLRGLYESLELPGNASDYHFVLMNAYESLWDHRLREPGVLPEIECLCLLDIKLVETRPETVLEPFGGREATLRVPAFSHLIRLYEREGFIEDALDIARRAAALGQGTIDLQRLEVRLQALIAEDES